MPNPSAADHRRTACPLCGAPVAAAHAPFCSAGCRNRDLLNWLGESYRVPAAGGPESGSESDRPGGLDSPTEPPL